MSRSPARGGGSCWPIRRRRARIGAAAGAGRRDDAAGRRAASWEDREEEMFGPAETLHSTYRLLRDEVLEGTMRAGGRLGRATTRHRPRRLARGGPLPRAAEAGRADRAPRGPVAGRGGARRELADPPGGDRRAAGDLHLVRARRLPPGRRARCAAAGGRGDGAGRPLGGVVPAHARRRDRPVRLRHRHVPDVPAEVQVRARIPDPAGADDPPAVRDRRAPGARALPRAGPGTSSLARWPSCSGCSTRAGGAADSATPRRSASCAARRPRL